MDLSSLLGGLGGGGGGGGLTSSATSHSESSNSFGSDTNVYGSLTPAAPPGLGSTEPAWLLPAIVAIAAVALTYILVKK